MKKEFRKANPCAFVAFFLGAFASYLPGIACINAVAVSMISYVVLSKVTENASVTKGVKTAQE
jgi:hypothetical protein